MYMLKKRVAKADLCGTSFFGRQSLLDLLSPVVRVKLLFQTSSIIIRTMCLEIQGCKSRDFSLRYAGIV